MIKKLIKLFKQKKVGVKVQVSPELLGSEDKGRIKKSKDTGLFLTFKF